MTFCSKFEFGPCVANCFAASRNAICFPLNVKYSSLGGQRPRIEVTIAHRQPWTILGGVTEVTFCSKFHRLGGDVAYIHIRVTPILKFFLINLAHHLLATFFSK